jgi:hypothetical protein
LRRRPDGVEVYSLPHLHGDFADGIGGASLSRGQASVGLADRIAKTTP